MTDLIRFDGGTLLFENNFFCMKYDCSGKNPQAVSCVLKSTGHDFIINPGREFRLIANDAYVSSEEARVEDVRLRRTADGGMCADIRCAADVEGLTVTVSYTIYPDAAGFRKELKFTSAADMRIERISIHETGAAPAAWSACDFYSGPDFHYEPLSVTYDGNGELLTCHAPSTGHGWMMASGVPGVLRFMMVYPHWHNVSAGYSAGAAACAKYLQPGREFTTAPIYFSLFSGTVGNAAARNSMNRLIRHSLPPDKFGDSVMYCSWIPFLLNIDEQLITAQAETAASLGFGHFVLDDGWFVPETDWSVDRKKFPGGLEKISDFIHSRNMKFGLWFNIGTAYGMKTPDERNFMPDSSGRAKKQGKYGICCPASVHRDMITEKLLRLAEKYQIDYFKLDFSTVSSPYGLIEYGCHAKDHAYHRDWNDSFIAAYEGLQKIRETLSGSFPELLIDFSFENFGITRPSLGGLLYSDIQHVSNLHGDDPAYQGIRQLRKIFTHWIGVLPPERILHGLLSLRDAESLLTGFCGAPLFSGNLTQIDSRTQARLAEYIGKYRSVVRREAPTSFEILAEEPEFDGFIRRGDSGHGFACCFNRSGKPRETVFGSVPANACEFFTF